MKIGIAVAAIDKLKPNMYSTEEKVLWLSRLDENVHNDIVMTHEHTEEQEEFTPYDANRDMDKELLIPSPYDNDVYLFYLESLIDFHNAETAKYINSSTMFNSAYGQFSNWYNRNHMPIGKKLKFF